MEYSVELTRRAERDLAHLYDRIDAAESRAAAQWFTALEKAVASLRMLPRRCPKAPESETAGRHLRHLLFGSKPYVYRIIYDLDEIRKTVLVLTIRHGFMDQAKPHDLR